VGEPALVLQEAAEQASTQTTRLIVIEGGGGTAIEGGGAAAGEAVAAGFGAAALSVVAFLAILLYPSSIAPEPPMAGEDPKSAPQAPQATLEQACPESEPRHPNQTCSNEELTKLQIEKDEIVKNIPQNVFDTGNEKKKMKIPCSYIKKKIQQMQKLFEKRWEIQNKCFGGVPDPVHEKAISDVERSMEKYRDLEKTNCVAGHPMAGQ